VTKVLVFGDDLQRQKQFWREHEKDAALLEFPDVTDIENNIVFVEKPAKFTARSTISAKHAKKQRIDDSKVVSIDVNKFLKDSLSKTYSSLDKKSELFPKTLMQPRIFNVDSQRRVFN